MSKLLARKLIPILAASSFLASNNIQATLSFNEDVIVKGTTIEVLGPGPDLQAIIDGISDESASNQYLIKLGPGQYTINSTLEMAEHINIMGSGETLTSLIGAISSGNMDAGSSIVEAKANTTLSHLNIKNTASPLAIAVAAEDQFLLGFIKLEHVALSASGPMTNIGVYLSRTRANIRHSTISGSLGETNYGIYGDDLSTPNLTDVNVSAASIGFDGNTNIGIFGNNVFGLWKNSMISARGDDNAQSTGIMLENSSRPVIRQVAVTAGGFEAFGLGLSNDGTSGPKIENSSFEGNLGIKIFSTAFRISNSIVVGGISDDPAGTQCHNVVDDDFVAVGC